MYRTKPNPQECSYTYVDISWIFANLSLEHWQIQPIPTIRTSWGGDATQQKKREGQAWLGNQTGELEERGFNELESQIIGPLEGRFKGSVPEWFAHFCSIRLWAVPVCRIELHKWCLWPTWLCNTTFCILNPVLGCLGDAILECCTLL